MSIIAKHNPKFKIYFEARFTCDKVGPGDHVTISRYRTRELGRRVHSARGGGGGTPRLGDTRCWGEAGEGEGGRWENKEPALSASEYIRIYDYYVYVCSWTKF